VQHVPSTRSGRQNAKKKADKKDLVIFKNMCVLKKNKERKSKLMLKRNVIGRKKSEEN